MADKNPKPGSKQADGNSDSGTSKSTTPDKEGMGASGGRTGSGSGKAGSDSAGGSGRKGQGAERSGTGIEQSDDSDS